MEGCASRHGSTREIADAIADELRLAELNAYVRDTEDVSTLDEYSGIVLGSAVYMGNWCPGAREFVERHRTRLATVPVWLFSSGPIGAPDPRPHGDPGRIAEFAQATHAREHRVFAGKLDEADLGLSERLVSRMVGAQSGDFRDWPAIRAWAREIAASLTDAASLEAIDQAGAVRRIGLEHSASSLIENALFDVEFVQRVGLHWCKTATALTAP